MFWSYNLTVKKEVRGTTEVKLEESVMQQVMKKKHKVVKTTMTS